MYKLIFKSGALELRREGILYHLVDNMVDESVSMTIKDEARALADAIYKDLGLGWKKYIPGESEPEKSGWYYTTIENENGMGLAYGLWTPETGFTDSGGWEIQDVVHAFRLPFELYQPEDSHDPQK